VVAIDLKGVNTVYKRLADGTVRTYYYHRASGKRLSGEPGSAEFLADYQDADRIAPRDSGTVASLIREFQSSLRYDRKRDSTKREYKRLLARAEEKFGTMPVAALASPRVVGKFVDYQEEVGRERGLREADNRLTVLSAAFSYAKSKGRIARNPLDRFERLYRGNRADRIWTEVDVLKFMKGAPVELQRAMILAIHTGQRYGDLVRVRWADYDGNAISLKQSKTSQRVWIKCTSALKAMLDKTPKNGPFILTRADGRPWHTEKDDKALGKAWTEHMRNAGLYPDEVSERLHFHDLRGTAVTLLAEAGASGPQIVAITGHTLESANRILEKYLSRTKRLSEAAIFAFENAKTTNFANRLQTSTPPKAEAG
jgi:integrase